MGAGCGSLFGAVVVSTWCRRSGLVASGPAGAVALVLWACVPILLSALPLCDWYVGFEYASISRF